MLAAIVLSAGKSERMGSPKALLQFRGRTFLATILDAIDSAGIRTVIVVAGHHYHRIATAFPDAPVIFNVNYEQGMSTSVQAGIRTLPPGLSGAAVFLVDHPLIDAKTIEILMSRLKAGHIVVPIHEGRRGHPVVFAADLFDEILALPPDLGLNTVVRKTRDRVLEVPVEDPGVIRDIDTPDQFAALLGEEQ